MIVWDAVERDTNKTLCNTKDKLKDNGSIYQF